jgi:hypothetical protein
MPGFHILVAGSLLGFPRERGQWTTAERVPSDCSGRGRQSSVGSLSDGRSASTRAVNHSGPSSTPELFAYANLGPVTTASVAVEVVAVSLCRGVSECWEHGLSPSCQLRWSTCLA